MNKLVVNAEEDVFVVVSRKCFNQEKESMKRVQAKMTLMRAARSPADMKLTVLLLPPFLLLPEELPGEVVGGGEELVDERSEEGLGVIAGGFVVLVVVVVVEVEVVEFMELLVVRVDERGRLAELVEFKQVVAGGGCV